MEKSRIHKGLLIALLGGALLTGAACAESTSGSPPADCVGAFCGTTCQSDLECPVGLRCDQGVCQSADQEQACQSDLSCEAGHQCVQGVCEPIEGYCERNSDCPPDQLCLRETLRCAPSDARPCANARDCFGGEACEDGLCVPDQADTPDAGPEDTGPPDVGPPDTGPEDVSEPPRDASEDTAPPQDTGPDDVGQDTGPDEPDVALPDVGPEDTGEPDADPEDADPEDTGPEDVAPDVLEDVVEDTAPDVAEDVAPDVVEDVGPPPTPPRGVYEFQRLPIGGLDPAIRAAFHPSGDYALVQEVRNVVHVFDWETQTSTRLVVNFQGDEVAWTDLAWDPSGRFAVLTGIRMGDAQTGVLYRFSDEAWRSQDTRDQALTPFQTTFPDPAMAIEYPWEGGTPVVMTRPAVRPSFVTLRGFDPELDARTDFITAEFSGIGCDDFAFANNAFGDPGILVVCGNNGAEVLYYTEIGGIGEWTHDPGNNNLGNTSRVAAYPGGAYALVVSWSGRAIYRFQDGQLNGYSDAPRYSRHELWSVNFQQEGQRALILGGAGATPLRATVIEYRHDEYTCPNSDSNCELTDTSIQPFNVAPYNGSSNATLNAAAWRPGCDGGIIVGGESTFQTSVGYLIRFQVLGQGTRPCR